MRHPFLKPIALAASLALAQLAGQAQTPSPPPVGDPSTVEDMRAALFGGVPGDRWKEGLLFEGISPHPWLNSASNWFLGTEDVQPDEMRIIFMGTSPVIRPGQMNTSVLVQLGNGENFVLTSAKARWRITTRRTSL